MKPATLALALSALLVLSACADEKVVVQKSPCVGIDGSPCGPKRTLTGNPQNTVENLRVSTHQHA